MNDVAQAFVDDLKQRPEVVGIVLFGSWARGNNRPDSDIDLLVYVREGFSRTVEFRDGQAFEITYTTEQGAIEYWQANKDDCVELWQIAKILFDRDGTVERLRKVGAEIERGGKERWTRERIQHITFDHDDQLRAVEGLAPNDPTTARMLLNVKVFSLTELFFDLRQLWTPPPKQRLEQIRQRDAGFYDLLARFYEERALAEQVNMVKAMIDRVFVGGEEASS